MNNRKLKWIIYRIIHYKQSIRGTLWWSLGKQSFLTKDNSFHVNRKSDPLNTVSVFPEQWIKCYRFLHLWKSSILWRIVLGLQWLKVGSLLNWVASSLTWPHGFPVSLPFIHSVNNYSMWGPARADTGGLGPWRAYSLLGDFKHMNKYKIWSLLSVILGATENSHYYCHISWLQRVLNSSTLPRVPYFLSLELLQYSTCLKTHSPPVSTMLCLGWYRVYQAPLTLASYWVQLEGSMKQRS